MLGYQTKRRKKKKEKKGPLDAFIDIISGIFTPVLGLLAATGMIKGLNVLFVSLGWIENTSGTYAILQAAGDCFFYFFPIFLGYTAAKEIWSEAICWYGYRCGNGLSGLVRVNC